MTRLRFSSNPSVDADPTDDARGIADELDRLAGLETFTLSTGTPLITGGLAHLDCHVVTTLGSGTHTIFIGEVLAAQNAGDGDPLIYYNRGYKNLI